MEIQKDIENTLLNRREIKFVIAADSNPGSENVRKSLSEKIKTLEENIAIKTINNNFGSKEFIIEAFVYNSREHKEKTESKPKTKKGAAA